MTFGFHTRWLVIASLLGLGPLYAGTATAADIKIGHLRCDVAGGISFVFGSTRDLECVYTPLASDRVEVYTGQIKTFGIDIGYRASGVMLWGVFAPAVDAGPGALAGEYVGASASVAVALGLGVDALIGGSENSIGLQPVSITGYQGINVAVGISSLELNAAE